jgi:hypothetical protein
MENLKFKESLRENEKWENDTYMIVKNNNILKTNWQIVKLKSEYRLYDFLLHDTKKNVDKKLEVKSFRYRGICFELSDFNSVGYYYKNESDFFLFNYFDENKEISDTYVCDYLELKENINKLLDVILNMYEIDLDYIKHFTKNRHIDFTNIYLDENFNEVSRREAKIKLLKTIENKIILTIDISVFENLNIYYKHCKIENNKVVDTFIHNKKKSSN